MFGAASSELPQRIGFVLIPNFSMIAFTSAVEPLRLANRAAGRELYTWRLFSADGKPVAASNGIVLHPSGNIFIVLSSVHSPPPSAKVSRFCSGD